MDIDAFSPAPKPLRRRVMSEADSNIRAGIYTSSALTELILKSWSKPLIKARVDANSTKFRLWVEFFIKYNLGLGTVVAWLGALLRCPLRFLGPGDNPLYGLKPEYFDSNCDVIEGCRLGGEPEIDTEGNILMTDGMTFARRIWDVYANRVIPSAWVPDVQPSPISHAWVAQKEIQYVWTPVNNYLWAVPIPKGISLNDVRAHLIRHNIEYTWLDVLCLRQVINGDQEATGNRLPEWLVEVREAKRLKEWETDVPLIGGIYVHAPRVVTYFYGLGRPFEPQRTRGGSQTHTSGDKERDWFKRAWTLQETATPHKMIPGGGQRGIMWPVEMANTAKQRLADISYIRDEGNVASLVREMQHRFASNPVDRVAGLFFPLWRRQATEGGDVRIPKYTESADPEDAWARLVHALASTRSFTAKTFAWQLLAHFPAPSAGHWFPSLNQVMQNSRADAQPGNHQANLRRPDELPPPVDYALLLRNGIVFPHCKCKIEPGSFKFIVSEHGMQRYIFAAPEEILSDMCSPEAIRLQSEEEYVIFSFYTILESPLSLFDKKYEAEELVIVSKNVTMWRPHQRHERRAFFRKIVSWRRYHKNTSNLKYRRAMSQRDRCGLRFDDKLKSWNSTTCALYLE